MRIIRRGTRQNAPGNPARHPSESSKRNPFHLRFAALPVGMNKKSGERDHAKISSQA